MTIPGVQNPHCKPCSFQNASWTRSSLPSVASPSMVVMRASVRLHGEQAARLHGRSVERNRAGAAKRCLATDMRAGESELVSQKVDEQEARLDFSRVAVSIHGDGNGALHSMPSLMLLIGLRYQIFGLLVNPAHPFADSGVNAARECLFVPNRPAGRSDLQGFGNSRSLTPESLERCVDFLLRFRTRGHERQPRRAAIVSHSVHRVLQAGDTVFRCHELGRFRDSSLPVLRRFKVSTAVRFPDRDASVRRGIRKGQYRADRPHLKMTARASGPNLRAPGIPASPRVSSA